MEATKFRIGERVEHPSYGIGEVVELGARFTGVRLKSGRIIRVQQRALMSMPDAEELRRRKREVKKRGAEERGEQYDAGMFLDGEAGL